MEPADRPSEGWTPQLGLWPRTRRDLRTTLQARRARRSLAASAALVGLALVGLSPVAAASGSQRVVVTGPDAAAAGAAVRAVGGSVVAELPLIGGVVAVVPEPVRLPGNVLVSPDPVMSFTADAGSPAATVSTVRATLGLPPTGDEGRGVTVAVVDTGVAEVGDLKGRIVGHIDTAGDGTGDGYGHGTFMAGLVAGSGRASGGAYAGVAPGARILDVKVARQDGTTDLGSVLTGLQAVSDRADGVQVLNLSLSSDSPLPYQLDPLNRALRALWRQGITVVVSSGNTGPGPGTVSAPGNDPGLLTVGGVNENGTSLHADDVVADWSSRGPTRQGVTKPDLVAPGQAVVGLRSPGSVLDEQHPSARVDQEYFRGSGTSMAAAVTSGAVAAVLAGNPKLQPTDVKDLLTGTAYDLEGADPQAAGHGGLDVAAAVAAAPGLRPGRGPKAAPAVPGDPATWRDLQEALDAQNRQAAVRAWAALGPQAHSWAAQSWAALDPAAQSWAAHSWAAQSWAGLDGSSQEWAARSWAAQSWAAQSWAGGDWSAHSWAAHSWAAHSWAAQSWAAQSWAAQSWAAQSWAAQSWAASSWSGIWR